MKINGMQMVNYWIVNYLFNLGFYLATVILFLFFGIAIFKLQVFAVTALSVQAIVFFGWGLSQVSLAFLISVFLSKSQTATIVGYSVAVWFTTIACAFNATVYALPNEMEWFLLPIPAFSFSRLLYYVSERCGYDHCMFSFDDIPPEFSRCLWALYITSVLYMMLALYLY